MAGANVRYARIHPKTNSNLLALDISLRRNDKKWHEYLSKDLKSIFINLFMLGITFVMYFIENMHFIKMLIQMKLKKLLEKLNKIGAKYPAEHNVGHMYQAEKNLKNFYKNLDPTNTFNPGIGKTSKKSNAAK